MRIIVTGHRPKKLPGKYDWAHPFNIKIMDWMKERLADIRDSYAEPVSACTGMALGVDQMFAHVCAEMGIDFTAFIPCKGHEKMWIESSIKLYKDLLEKSSSTILTSKTPYYDGCMQERNFAMRDWALEDKNSVLLAVSDGTQGGTENMIKICRAKKVRVIYYEWSLEETSETM